MTNSHALRIFSAVAAAAVCGLLIVVGAVVIPQQGELARQQEEALKNHDDIKARQMVILERLAAVESQTRAAFGRPDVKGGR